MLRIPAQEAGRRSACPFPVGCQVFQRILRSTLCQSWECIQDCDGKDMGTPFVQKRNTSMFLPCRQRSCAVEAAVFSAEHLLMHLLLPEGRDTPYPPPPGEAGAGHRWSLSSYFYWRCFCYFQPQKIWSSEKITLRSVRNVKVSIPAGLQTPPCILWRLVLYFTVEYYDKKR